jgi:hypothetical protein
MGDGMVSGIYDNQARSASRDPASTLALPGRVPSLPDGFRLRTNRDYAISRIGPGRGPQLAAFVGVVAGILVVGWLFKAVL